MSTQAQIVFTAQLYDAKIKRDGTGRIVLETGLDSIPAIKEILDLLAYGDVNLSVAIVANLKPRPMRPRPPDVDDNGEIIME